MKKIIDIMKMDLITAKGGKKGTKAIIILLFLFSAFLIICVAPVGALYTPLLLCGFIVPTLFSNEVRYHSDKMPLLLPIERKELVRARFILTAIIYIAINLITYIMVLISLKTKIYTMLINNYDIMKMISKSLSSTEIAVTNFSFFSALMICSFITSNALRGYFKNNQVYTLIFNPKNSAKKGEMIKLAIAFFAIIIFILIISDTIPLGSAGSVILQLLLQAVNAANGFIFCISALTISAFEFFYQYVSTLVEYEKKDL